MTGGSFRRQIAVRSRTSRRSPIPVVGIVTPPRLRWTRSGGTVARVDGAGEIGERVRLTVAGISPSLIDALINEMGPSFPEHVPGTRPIHSKGVGVAGMFVASQAAWQYCTASISTAVGRR